MRCNTWITGAAAMLLWAPPAAADAQGTGRFYAGAAASTFRMSADEVSGTSTAGAVFAGVRMRPWLDVEGEVSRPARAFTRSYGGDTLSMSFGSPGASREELERMGIWLRYDKRREILLSFSGAVVFHPPLHARVTPGLIVGVANHRVHDRTDYTPTRVGPGVDPRHPYASPHAESPTRVLGALTIGANVAVALTRHISVVPDVRYDYGSIGDEINNWLRPSVRMIWNF